MKSSTLAKTMSWFLPYLKLLLPPHSREEEGKNAEREKGDKKTTNDNLLPLRIGAVSSKVTCSESKEYLSNSFALAMTKEAALVAAPLWQKYVSKLSDSSKERASHIANMEAQLTRALFVKNITLATVNGWTPKAHDGGGADAGASSSRSTWACSSPSFSSPVASINPCDAIYVWVGVGGGGDDQSVNTLQLNSEDEKARSGGSATRSKGQKSKFGITKPTPLPEPVGANNNVC
jgi:hypothetical protein